MVKFGRSVVYVVVGVALALAGFHLYVDHQLLHVLVQIESIRQQNIREGK